MGGWLGPALPWGRYWSSGVTCRWGEGSSGRLVGLVWGKWEDPLSGTGEGGGGGPITYAVFLRLFLHKS